MKTLVVTMYNGDVIAYKMKDKSDHIQYYNRYKRIADTIVLKQDRQTVVLKR